MNFLNPVQFIHNQTTRLSQQVSHHLSALPNQISGGISHFAGHVPHQLSHLSDQICDFPIQLSSLVTGLPSRTSGLAMQIIQDQILTPHHEMQTHVFKEATHGAAKLYYQGDIPILELNYDDPRSAGYDHGYLMGEYFEKLLNRMSLINRTLNRPQARDLPQTLQAILKLLPKDYVSEIEGMAEGYNQWLKDHSLLGVKDLLGTRDVTVEDVILFHLMPDSLHFDPKEVEAVLQGEPAPVAPDGKKKSLVGCTVVIDKDDDKGITFGRNMDWPSFGVFGKYSLIINRKYNEDKLSTIELGFPGFLGSLTGMNKNGLSVAMNVCSHDTATVKGLPAAFFNRLCLETCKDVAAIQSTKNRPLGAYHLSTADSKVAKSFHYYQGNNRSRVMREWKKQEQKPLITTNCQYVSSQGENGNLHCSSERKAEIEQLFNNAKKQAQGAKIETYKLVEASLSLPFVNNELTTHKVVMYPQSRKIQIAVDNKLAGQVPLHSLNTELLFA